MPNTRSRLIGSPDSLAQRYGIDLAQLIGSPDPLVQRSGLKTSLSFNRLEHIFVISEI